MSRLVSRVIPAGRRGSAAAEIPVITWTGDPGPTVIIAANLHGDEVSGLGTVHRLDTWLPGRPLRGTVVLYPSANPAGLAALSRTVPGDDVDLNRMFPGNARGGGGARLAAAMWRDLCARKPSVVLDLHADATAAIPYVIVDRPVRHAAAARRELATRIEGLAGATGITVLREFPDEQYLQFGLDRSLAGAVVNQLGVPALTLEVGPRRRLDPDSVEVMFEAVRGVLVAAGLVDAPSSTHVTRVEGPWRRVAGPRVRGAGVLVPARRAGEVVMRGERLARLLRVSGEVEEEVVAAETCLVVSWVDHPWLNAGWVVGTMAVSDGERL